MIPNAFDYQRASSLDEALGAVKWSADHHFWRSVVLSMPKLREHYGAMLLQAQEKQARRTPGGSSGPSHNSDVLARRRARREAQG